MDKRFIKGLFKDTAHIDQPEGSWRYAKNAITNNKKGSISNEGGNEIAGHLGNNPTTGAQNDKVIGKIEVDNNRVILFVKDVVNTPGRSEIGIWENNVYTILFNPNLSTDLNFQETNPIEGTFKIDSKGDLVIYFTDDLNPPRAFNADRQIRESGANVSRLYGSVVNDIELLNLFPHSGAIPHVELDTLVTHQSSVLEGGGLLTGVYYLALAYVDDDFVATNFVTVSNPISIVDEFDFTRPTTKKDGAKEGSQTTKSIKWKINNLNTDYKYLKPVVIRKMGDATEGFRLNDVEIFGSTLNVTFSSIEGSSPASVDDVIIDTVSYDTAKTIQQLDNVLYLGNLTSSQDLGYQKYANDIRLHSVTKTIENFDEYYATIDGLNTGFNNTRVDEYDGAQQTVDNTKSYRYQPNIFKYKGYMRDEVYAFYIAFILKDGSMSYAYHIPGREGLTEEVRTVGGGLSGQLWSDIYKLNRKYAKNFHFLDRTALHPAAPWSDHRQMNFWQNATELYPNTDDYEIWDNTGYTGNDLKGKRVRHHHFPSNKNSARKSITSTNCETASSMLTPGQPAKYNNIELVWQWDEDVDGARPLTHNGAYTRYRFNKNIKPSYPSTSFTKGYWSGNNIISPSHATAAANLFNGNDTFKADQQMTVDIMFNIWLHQDLVGIVASIKNVHTRCRTNASSLGPGNHTLDHDTISSFGTGICAGTRDDYNKKTGMTVVLEAGESIWLESVITNTGSGNDDCHQSNMPQQVNAGWLGGCAANPNKYYDPEWDCGDNGEYMICKSFITFRVNSTTASIPQGDYNDAKISHDVDVLGFELNNLRIPAEIEDKVQGFRIYYADRNHADKTILGQSVAIPATPKVSQIGICKEAAASTNNSTSLSVLQTLKNEVENFWNIEPFAKSITEYGTYPQMQLDATTPVSNEPGYKVFSFHDFSLIRSHKSLAAATHIDPQYKTRNFAWNGAKIEQEKKMVTILDTSTTPDSLKEIWGWDTEFNCYPQDIKSAILIGNEYNSISNTMQPRLLDQKAKTYLPGDSIFEGEALGFGGKLFNEFGESSILFALKDNHEIPVSKAQNRPYTNAGWVGSNAFPNAGHYGVIGTGEPILTNPLPWAGTGGNVKSQDFIVNLKAFKTDVYKSIDSQDLIWTGFEVLGEDLEHFKLSNSNAHFKTDSLTTVNGEDHEGIFGGDTYICRYGIGTALKSSHPEDNANPERAVHYHIVESTDNINFRHTQDSDSAYFPNSPSTKILEYVGIKDFSSKDNSRYNDNYSELNDLRTAFPLPLKQVLQDDFPTRTIRSAKADSTSLIDNYRIFLANQFKDLPKNRGDLWKLSSFNNLLYFHMEESLFAAQGKQTMSMKDGSEAFVGSGDIFKQEPNEMIQTKGGYGGTASQWASLTTRHGYFFVNANAKKVFLMGEKLQEISAVGMEAWFKENLKFVLEDYGFINTYDNPIFGFGYSSIWDPKNRRIILTKREYTPTPQFIINSSGISFDSIINKFKITSTGARLEWSDQQYFEKGGWTISYSPEANTWTSFHDYIPYIYFNTSTDFYSLTDKYERPVNSALTNTTFGNAGIWKHNSETNKGILYQEGGTGSASTLYVDFEVEFIHNDNKGTDTLVSNISYISETFNQAGVNVLEHGFTDFFLYNTLQISGTTEMEYLINTRRVGNSWTINKFRDMAAVSTNTNSYYMSPNINLVGGINTGTVTTSSINSMFDVAGMVETPNGAYLNMGKSWDQQRKFTDKWVGIRLICDNKQNNLLNLYSTSVGARKVHR